MRLGSPSPRCHGCCAWRPRRPLIDVHVEDARHQGRPQRLWHPRCHCCDRWWLPCIRVPPPPLSPFPPFPPQGAPAPRHLFAWRQKMARCGPPHPQHPPFPFPLPFLPASAPDWAGGGGGRVEGAMREWGSPQSGLGESRVPGRGCRAPQSGGPTPLCPVCARLAPPIPPSQLYCCK